MRLPVHFVNKSRCYVLHYNTLLYVVLSSLLLSALDYRLPWPVNTKMETVQIGLAPYTLPFGLIYTSWTLPTKTWRVWLLNGAEGASPPTLFPSVISINGHFPTKTWTVKSLHGAEGALPPTLFPLVKSTVGHFPTKIRTKQSLNGGEGLPPTLFPLVLKAHMLIFSTASWLYQHVYKQKLAICSGLLINYLN